jgi:hypothetical protein
MIKESPSQETNLEFEYLREFETEFMKKLGLESRFHMGLILKKIGGQNLVLLSL